MGLPQYGGEGKENYKGNKSDMSLPQHGGEGKNIKTTSGDLSFTPKRNVDVNYSGPARNLKTESYTR